MSAAPAIWSASVTASLSHTAALPLGRIDAVLFDLDGVVTDTAALHATVWKRVFDDWLAERARRTGGAFEPFEIARDYRHHVDGRPRYEGAAAFLASRGIVLPFGEPADPPERETICGIANRKDAELRRRLREGVVAAYPSTVALVRALRERDVPVAVFSASRHAAAVLRAVGADALFDARVDGIEAAGLGLPGKPSPATLLEAARRLGVPPARAAVVEDAIAGVQAGRRGGFGLVVAVDRGGIADALRAAGADVVVADLAALEVVPAQ